MPYQIFKILCIPRLTQAIPTQQQNPVKIGFPPVFTRLIIFVFNPIAAIAIIIKNLLSSLSGMVIEAGSWKIVVTTDASTKNNTKYGKDFFKLKEEPPLFFSLRPL